jgi:hypothetical protein
LRQLGSNPARGSSRFEVRGSATAPADLEIYDSRGRLVRTLLAGERVDRRVLAWDGLDASGRFAPTGVYFARLSEGGLQRSAKFVLMR